MDRMNEKDSIRAGAKVYGIFAHFHPTMYRRTVNTRYEGIVVKVEGDCFWVKYTGLRINFLHRFGELGRNVFLDEMKSENRLTEIDSPMIKIGG